MKNADDWHHRKRVRGEAMPIRAFVFDAYGTLFDVHAAVARYRDAAGPEADRFSEIWRTEAARICLDAVRRRALRGLLDADRARARSCVRALPVGRSRAAPRPARLLFQARRISRRARGAGRAQGQGTADRDPVERLAEDAWRARSRTRSIGGDLDAVFSVDTIRIYKPRAEVYALVTDAFASRRTRSRSSRRTAGT